LALSLWDHDLYIEIIIIISGMENYADHASLVRVVQMIKFYCNYI